jgi:hypothetical protein
LLAAPPLLVAHPMLRRQLAQHQAAGLRLCIERLHPDPYLRSVGVDLSQLLGILQQMEPAALQHSQRKLSRRLNPYAVTLFRW